MLSEKSPALPIYQNCLREVASPRDLAIFGFRRPRLFIGRLILGIQRRIPIIVIAVRRRFIAALVIATAALAAAFAPFLITLLFFEASQVFLNRRIVDHRIGAVAHTRDRFDLAGRRRGARDFVSNGRSRATRRLRNIASRRPTRSHTTFPWTLHPLRCRRASEQLRFGSRQLLR